MSVPRTYCKFSYINISEYISNKDDNHYILWIYHKPCTHSLREHKFFFRLNPRMMSKYLDIIKCQVHVMLFSLNILDSCKIQRIDTNFGLS